MRDFFARYKAYWINACFAVLNMLLVLAVFSEISTNEEWMNVFFCSDTLYLPSIYKDAITKGNGFEGWHLNAAPNFFPDMLVYFVLMFITNSFIASSLIFSILQYSFITWLLGRIFKLLFPSSPGFYFVLAIHLLSSAFLLETFFFTKDFPHSFYILSNAYHTGSFVLAITCFYITLKYIRDKKFYLLLALLALELLGVISDRLFIVTYMAPMLVTAFFLLRSLEMRTVFWLIVTMIAGFWTGLNLFDDLKHSNYVFFNEPSSIYNYSRIHESAQRYINQMQFYIERTGFRQLSVILFFLSLVLILVLLVSGWKKLSLSQRCYCVFTLALSFSLILAPVINGSYLGNDNLRYSISCFYLFPLNLAVFARFFIKGKFLQRIGRPLALIMAACCVFISVNQLRRGGLEIFFDYYPKTVRQLDSIVPREHLLCGVSNYWEAKKTLMFSRKNIELYPAYADLNYYEHVANEKWFYGKNIFNFMLLDNFNDTILVPDYLKPIEIIPNTGSLKLVKVSTFKYFRQAGFKPVKLDKLK